MKFFENLKQKIQNLILIWKTVDTTVPKVPEIPQLMDCPLCGKSDGIQFRIEQDYRSDPSDWICWHCQLIYSKKWEIFELVEFPKGSDQSLEMNKEEFERFLKLQIWK
jgi:hypothetical protein